MNCSRIIIKYIERKFNSELIDKEKNCKMKKKEYWVKFCVKYRPVGMLEWILARGWWNDKWIRTPDWIFNDWKL